MTRGIAMVVAIAVGAIALQSCSGENCTPRDHTYCVEDITYWVNSCGDMDEIFEHCLVGCESGFSACKEGECEGDAACSDQNPCTDDSCINNFCQHTNNRASCDDGNACTVTDLCSNGMCKGTALTCDDQIPCTVDSCHPASGCQNTPEHTLCNDGDGCTADTCSAHSGCDYADACDVNASCVARACQCDQGFRGDGTVCDDIDECAEHSHACDPNASCSNNWGSYSCTCNPPYTGDGFTCGLCGNGECDGGETRHSCPADCDLDIVVIVENSLLSGLSSALDTYLADLRNAGKNARTMAWTGGSVQDLRNMLATARSDYAIEGALLLGHLPSAWYECECWQDSDPMHEEYPTDIYLMDLDASWYDSDGDGMYNSHSILNADIFVSRVTGNTTVIRDYLAKVHTYRTSGSLTPQKAFIFIDDDWEMWAGNYGLDAIYWNCDLVYDLSQTTRATYLSRMDDSGAEFVYQWIHASPQELYISHNSSYQIVYLNDVINGNHQASFLNLFNCSAARYTEVGGCLSQTYLTRTDYGLADIGSTKTGGIYTPDVFHSRLASGHTWGEAYRQWYNASGVYDDEWHLGIVISGDPLLTIQGTTLKDVGELPARKWTPEEIAELSRKLVEHARQIQVGTFEEYRLQNPQFFGERE